MGAAGGHVPRPPPHWGGGPAGGRGLVSSYLLRRLWQSLLVLFGVSVVVFLILHLTGDPAALLLPPDATAEDVARFRTAMGFDDTVVAQYLRFLKGALRA